MDESSATAFGSASKIGWHVGCSKRRGELLIVAESSIADEKQAAQFFEQYFEEEHKTDTGLREKLWEENIHEILPTQVRLDVLEPLSDVIDLEGIHSAPVMTGWEVYLSSFLKEVCEAHWLHRTDHHSGTVYGESELDHIFLDDIRGMAKRHGKGTSMQELEKVPLLAEWKDLWKK